MTNYTKMTLLGAALAAFLLPGMAQTSTPTPPSSTPSAPSSTPTPPSTAGGPSSTPTKGPETIQQHKQAQQNRISNGISNGELTSDEASSLEKKESNINQEERSMKSEDDGHLTSADRTALRQQQDQVSKQIYQDKHNDNTQNTHPQTEIGQRREDQRQRIANGVSTGQLTAGQAGHIEKQEGSLNTEVKNDRAADGGKLTQAQKTQINNQQNHLSKEIHKDKTKAKTGAKHK